MNIEIFGDFVYVLFLGDIIIFFIFLNYLMLNLVFSKIFYWFILIYNFYYIFI